jgi:hypothetical protein
MTTAAKISIQLEAQTATLQKGFADAKTAIKDLGDHMATHVAHGAFAAELAMKGLEKAVDFAKESLRSLAEHAEAIMKLEHLAERLGMASDALRALGYAATLTGGSAEGMAGDIEKMNKNIDDAFNGSKELEEAFGRLNLNVADLMGMRADQRFAAIADGISQVENTAERAQLILKLFGRAGGELTNLLAEGSRGIEEFRAKFEQLGGTMGTQSSEVRGAIGAWHNLKTAWSAFLDHAAARNAQLWQPMLDRLTGAIAYINQNWWGSGGSVVSSEGVQQRDSARELQEAQDRQRELDEFERKLKESQEKLAQRAAAVARDVQTPWERFTEQVDNLNELARAGAISWQLYSRGVARASEEFDKAGKAKAAFESTPAVGALTRASVAGFSAEQAAQRAAADAERRFQAIQHLFQQCIAAIEGSTVVLAPRSL